MKIFAIYCPVRITHQPDWLEGFRAKYDKPYEYHITLKQPCYIDEQEVSSLKTRVAAFVQEQGYIHGTTSLTFDKLYIDIEDMSIMIHTTSNSSLHELQRRLVAETLVGYTQYCEPKAEAWEKHFQPHITIGRDLGVVSLEQAKADLRDNATCTGDISEIVLSVVQEDTPKEAANPGNKTIYSL